MSLTNKWVGYLDRSYEQIKASLLNRLVVVSPEITDHSSSNPLIIILEMFAGVGEMLGLYIDNMAMEAFVATCRRYVSGIKHANRVDYRVMASIPASVEVVLTFNTGITSDYIIPIGTAVKTSNNIIFISIEPTQVLAGATNAVLKCKQWERVINNNFGTTDGTPRQAIPLPSDYCNDTLAVVIDSEIWTMVDTFGYSKQNDKHFIVDVEVTGIPYLIFGDDLKGKIPTPNKTIEVSYMITSGPDGNVSENTITQLASTLSLPGITTITLTNPLKASAGSDVESLSQLKLHIPLSVRTLKRAVTRQDFKDIARLCPGVAKADLVYNCGKWVNVYIVPNGGGIASNVLLNDLEVFFDDKREITTMVRAKAAGETKIKLILDVTAKFREVLSNVHADTMDALSVWGSFDNQEINSSVRVSDIYALIDNLKRVKYLNIVEISSMPYASPVNHTTQLVWVRRTLLGSTIKTFWKLSYVSPTLGTPYFVIYRDNIFQGYAYVGTEWVSTSNDLKFTINGGVYTNGMQWEFYSYPINKDIVLDDFSVPIIDTNDVEINVIPTYTEQI